MLFLLLQLNGIRSELYLAPLLVPKLQLLFHHFLLQFDIQNLDLWQWQMVKVMLWLCMDLVFHKHAINLMNLHQQKLYHLLFQLHHFYHYIHYNLKDHLHYPLSLILQKQICKYFHNCLPTTHLQV